MTQRKGTPTDLDFFEARVFRPETPCWNWRAYVGRNGYGKWVRTDRQASAHRVAYELLVGPIPEGMQLHHKCFNRSCVNPEHLEPVTPRRNKELGLTAVTNRAKTHCPQGHPLSGDNLVKTAPRRGRVCRTCNAERSRATSERKRRERGVLPRADYCKNGHERTPENIIWSKDGKRRRCRLCAAATARKPGGYKDPNRARKTHCPHGHEYTPENTYTYTRDGREYRYCRECNRQAARRRTRYGVAFEKNRSETEPPAR